MTRAERAVHAASAARDLCLSLQRAFVGRPALERLRAGQAAELNTDALRSALGLAWAQGDIELIRAALARFPEERIADDPVLLAFREMAR